MRFVLIGPVKGATRKCFGFQFTNGVAEIPGEAVANCGHVLREHYSAFPVNEAEAAQKAFDELHPGFVPKKQPRGPEPKVMDDLTNDDGSVRGPVAGSGEAATLEEVQENPAEEESPKAGKSGKARGK